MFEIGCRYLAELSGYDDGQGKVLPRQDHWLGLVFSANGQEQPFNELKKIILGLSGELGLVLRLVKPKNFAPWFHPSRAAELCINDWVLGYLTEVEPEIATKLGLDNRTAVAEINLTRLVELPAQPKVYEKISEFPDAKRDIAFVVVQNTAFEILEKQLRSVSELLHSIELFDVYQGKGVDPDKKSLAIHLTFRSSDRTLSSEEVDNEMSRLRDLLVGQFGAIMR